MAGSLAHIVDDDGTFRMGLIENLRDAREALEECHQIIAELLEMMTLAAGEPGGLVHFHGVAQPLKGELLAKACERLGFPVPDDDDGRVTVPVIDPGLHGYASVYNPPKGD
jgi:hypothetical protein